MKRYIVRWYNTDLAHKNWHKVPEELSRQINQSMELMAEAQHLGVKLISLVPAPSDVPEGFYLATFEVTE